MKKFFQGLFLSCFILVLAACGSVEPKLPELETQNVTITSGVMQLYYSFGVPNAKIVVGPAQGRIEVYGLPGVAEGSVYTGVKAIDWRSGAGFDGIQFEIEQSADFDIKVDTGSSDANIQTQWKIPAGASTTLTPSLNLVTGPGIKNVQVQLESFTPNINFALIGRMGAGDTLFKGDLQFKQGSLNAKGTVDFSFGAAQNNIAELIVDNEARNLNLVLSPRFMRELVTKIVGDDPSDSARVSFKPTASAGGSKIGFEMISTAPQIVLNHTVLGGAGVDEVNLGLSTLNTAKVVSNVNMRLGQSNDKLEMKYGGLPSNQNTFKGPIYLEGGDDEAKLEYQGVTNYAFSLDCGADVDKATGFMGSVINCEM